MAWDKLFSELFESDNWYSDEELTNAECGVYYDKYSNENRAWTVSLILMSWTLRNFQRKMGDGHCRNTTHEHGVTEPRNCNTGRQFHEDLLKKCLRSLA